MKRLLIGLYPRAWRERYGAELDALLADAPQDWRTNLDVIKGALSMRFMSRSAGKIVLAFLAVGLLAGLAIPRLFTPQWQAKGVARYKLAANEDLDEAILKTFSEVTSRGSLAKLITDPHLDLYANERAAQPLESIADKMRASIKVQINPGRNPSKMPGVFTVAFIYPDAAKAKLVTTLLLSNFARLGAIEVLDQPSLPSRPFFPNYTSIMVVAILTSLLLAGTTLIVKRRRLA